MAKKIHHKEKLVKYKSNTKMLWKTLNEIFNKSKTFYNTNKTDIITDPKEIATNFNVNETGNH